MTYSWVVVRRFRKAGKSLYELSNGIETRIIEGYQSLIKFLAANKIT